jgi:hypothetical protein
MNSVAAGAFQSEHASPLCTFIFYRVSSHLSSHSGSTTLAYLGRKSRLRWCPPQRTSSTDGVLLSEVRANSAKPPPRWTRQRPPHSVSSSVVGAHAGRVRSMSALAKASSRHVHLLEVVGALSTGTRKRVIPHHLHQHSIGRRSGAGYGCGPQRKLRSRPKRLRPQTELRARAASRAS